MTANYQREIQTLKEYLSSHSDTVLDHLPPLDVAFLPLDSRLEENYAMGIRYFLEHIPVKHVFPMHMWDDYNIVNRYEADYPQPPSCNAHSAFHPITGQGDHWEF